MALNCWLFFCLVLIGFVCFVDLHPIDCQICYKNPHRPQTAVAARDFLRRYGYLKDSCFFNPVRTSFTDTLLEAIIDFQEWNELKITGKLDDDTLDLMGTERCGVPDVMDHISVTIVSHRGKRQAQVSARRWRTTNLTYQISSYSDDLSPGLVDGIIREAWQIWSDVTPLTFTQVDASVYAADMEISFVKGVHGDADPFDGPGGVEAHAFYPGGPDVPLSGDTHFDDDERWTLVREETGSRLFCVAIHEFGHALGLEHSNRKDSVMYPWKRNCGNGSLSDYDMILIQGIYGPNTKTGITPSINITMGTFTQPSSTATVQASETTFETTETTFETTETPDTQEPVCTTTIINTCTTTAGTTTTFETTTGMIRNDTMTTTTMTTPTKPRKNTTTSATTTMTTVNITSTMETASRPEVATVRPGCPPDGKLDAVDVAGDGNTYGFKGTQIYRFTSEGVFDGFPKPISSVFPNSPLTVDAAVTVITKTLFIKKVRTYIFKGDKVWKYIYQKNWGRHKFVLRKGYPKLIKHKFGIKVKKIDAAFNLKSHKLIYLTEGDKLYKIRFMTIGGPRHYKPISISSHPTLKYLQHVESAMRYTNGAYYFFKGDYYNRLVPSGTRGSWTHARYSLVWWFDCKPPNTEEVQRPAGDSTDGKFAKSVILKDL